MGGGYIEKRRETDDYLKEHRNLTKEIEFVPTIDMAPRTIIIDGDDGTVPVIPFPPAIPIPVLVRGRGICRNAFLGIVKKQLKQENV